MSGTNHYTDLTVGTAEATNVDTDASGQTTVTVSELKAIEDPTDVRAYASGGYLVNVMSVSDQDVTVEVRASAGTSGTELPLVTSGTDVTDVYVVAEGV
jgi:hypothetical protein